MRPTGAVARSFEDMRSVPGWSVENVARALGRKPHLHEAVSDVQEEAQIYHLFQEAWEHVSGGAPLEDALRNTGILRERQSALDFFRDLYDLPLGPGT